ncbi:Uncharacterized conserved protein [Phaffia rhodozyma]|uniref:Uncharacterized conserved protein n=1 Tax=Phaffia rhodozyma TaxID=264483 RepID=A0A0F7SNL8_PHARH|nr:Uncharacterized conserved protein [Phaffia rhodozyma]
MCIVVYDVDAHPVYKLILANNRDEFLHRPTEQANYRFDDLKASSEKDGNILCGLDTVGGGTWLGMSIKTGQVGILTNFTEPSPETPYPSTRGTLVTSYLNNQSISSSGSSQPSFLTSRPRDYISSLAPSAQSYGGFNLLLFDLFPPTSESSPETLNSTETSCGHQRAQLGYFSNRLEEAWKDVSDRTLGIGALSNSVIDDPWVKVNYVKHEMEQLLRKEEDEGRKWGDEDWIENLRTLMSPSVPTIDRSTFKHSVTIPPLRLPSTPNSQPRWYGTRSLTILLVTYDGRFRFVEEDIYVLDSSSNQPLKANDSRRDVHGFIKGFGQ